MTLFTYDFSGQVGCVFVNNIDTKAFLTLWGPDAAIEVTRFYGNVGAQYYCTEDCSGISTVSGFVEYLAGKEDALINDVAFTCGAYTCEINDMYEYHIYSDVINLKGLMEYILKELVHVGDTGVLNEVYGLEAKYILFDSGEIKEVFDSFDEYLSSPYEI